MGLPKARRFPLRITLSEFASALNSNRDLSLIAFMAREVGRRTGRTVSPDDLLGWLSAYPWFLVLDGLDEVPPSTNREDLLKKLEDFWIDAAQVNADVLVLATTRPQGYNDDFSPAHYQHLWLAPLSPRRSMAYAQRLVEVRYAGEPDRQKKILTRLEQASKQEATARLMRSPLQITIMAALVDQTGNPPQDRWRLFHDYYEVIYNRERERPIPAAELLRDYKPNIDAIHHQVGLTLQVENERAGRTEAKLPADRFAELVTARLEEEGFSESALHKLKDRIIDAAANRLVFLVGLEAGQVGFEIRSLQEYMAAEAIMTGGQDKIQERLRRFAPIGSWRNVFLFAAGRCFLQEQHLRDTIHTVCIELNDQLAGAVGRATLSGSALALDLIEDGVARRQPKYARLLGQCAGRLLELPPAEIHSRLADACEGEVEIVVRENVETKLAVPGPESLPAWAALLALVGRGLHWASELADRCWPTEPSQELTLLSLPTAERATAWVGSRVEAVIRGNPPDEVWMLLMDLPTARRQSFPFYKLAEWMREYHRRELRVQLPDLNMICYQTGIDQAKRIASEVRLDGENIHVNWLPTIEEVKFSRSPSKQALADGLRRIATAWTPCRRHFYDPCLSWVFGSCLSSPRSLAELVELAERADRGDLGDLPDWLAAERRWRERGVVLEDLLHLTEDRWPFDGEIAHRGYPIVAWYLFSGPGPTKAIALGNLVARLNDAPRVQATLAPWLFFMLAESASRSGPPPISPELFVRLVRVTESETAGFDVVLLAAQWGLSDERWVDILDEIGRTKRVAVHGYRRETGVQALLELFARYPSRAGLLPLIVAGLKSFPSAAAPTLEGLNIPGVRFEEYDDPQIRWAAVILELVLGDPDRNRAGELATITTMLRSQGAANLETTMGVLARCERFNDAVDHYLLELRRQLSDANWEDQATVVGGLNDSFRRRSSGVTEVGVWRSLALPEKLLDLVATSRL